MSTLFFDTVSARQLVQDVHNLATSISPIAVETTDSSDFAAALIAAVQRTNSQSQHLATYLERVAANSERIVAHAEHQDQYLGRALEDIA
ncbi:hypothetical protein [Corynebacterium sp. H130]|uniref:hypothetical protein n=1 Tax=Corynebacterium sp. H130 TaxID=3133444 RepID=UPI00309A26A0